MSAKLLQAVEAIHRKIAETDKAIEAAQRQLHSLRQRVRLARAKRDEAKKETEKDQVAAVLSGGELPADESGRFEAEALAVERAMAAVEDKVKGLKAERERLSIARGRAGFQSGEAMRHEARTTAWHGTAVPVVEAACIALLVPDAIQRQLASGEPLILSAAEAEATFSGTALVATLLRGMPQLLRSERLTIGSLARKASEEAKKLLEI